MEKLKMHTPNLADEKYEKLKELFPNAITETLDDEGNVIRAIDKDVLMQEINTTVVDDKKERFQFTWPDKHKSIILANQPIAKTLRLEKEKSVGKDGTLGKTDSENIYIEGDNLEALKLLQETYLGKVKIIYIDPPYNTGSDFIYKDKFVQSLTDYTNNSGQTDDEGNRLVPNPESNGRFHTDWLNMMYPRLKLSRDLLCENGVIFISIDNNEYEKLKQICDEIFGYKSYVTTLHVELSATQGMKVKAAQNGNIVKNAEYILIYSRDGHKNIALNKLYDYRPEYDSHYSNIICDDGKSYTSLKSEIQKQYPNVVIKNLVDSYEKSQVVRQFIEENKERIFRFDKTTGFNINDFDKERIYFHYKKNDREYTLFNNGREIQQLMFLSSSFGYCDDFQHSYGLRKIRGDYWKEFYKDMGNVSKEGDTKFENGKKPVRLIKQLIYMLALEDDIILDFFSGSATTAHAVMQLNAEDGGHRKFILVQLPEKIDNKSDDYKVGRTICDIGEARIRKSGKKIKEQTNADIDYGFRCFKVGSSNMKDVYYRPGDLGQMDLDQYADNIKEDRGPEDLLIQVMLDLGVLLSSKVEKIEIADKNVYSVENGYLMACFDKDITDDVVTAIAKKQPFYAVFRDNSMANDSVEANFEQIFETYSPRTIRKVL